MMPRAPLSLKVPVVVAIFMIAMSVFISEQVLSRLQALQTRHLETLAQVHLDGLATALVDAVLREDVWEVFAMLDRPRRDGADLTAMETVVAAMDGRVIAATDPRRVTSGADLPGEYRPPGPDAPHLRIDGPRAFAHAAIVYNAQPIGIVHAKFDIAPLLAERRRVLTTLIWTNAGLTIALVGAAWITVRRMFRPLRILISHLEQGVAGTVAPIPPDVVGRAGSEFHRLYSAFNALAAGVGEREDLIRRLAEEEKLASLGRLTSGMAHEINNPLGGLFNALETLKRHGDKPLVRTSALNLIDRGLRGIRDIVRAALVAYRPDRDGRPLDGRDLDDLKLLAGPELRRRALTLTWHNGCDGAIDLPAAPVRQIALNLLLNACQAAPPGGTVEVRIAAHAGALTVAVDDSGPGLPPPAEAVLTRAHDAVPPVGTGLGLWMTARLVGELAGRIAVSASRLGGARICVTLPLTGRGTLTDVA